MGVGEMLISGIIVIGFFSFYFWTTRYFKAKAEQGDKLQEFSAYKVRVGAIITSVVAGTLIVMMLSIWQSLENRMIAAGFILFALAWTCYAWFKWYRSRKRG